MIIKLIPVKHWKAVKNTVEYIAFDKGRIADYRSEGIFHNLYAHSLEDVTSELNTNYDNYATKRKNGNRAMHCILSISPLHRDHMTPEIMHDLVEEYLQRAYPNAQAYGTIHKHEAHYHAHVIVSGNELMQARSTRQSKDKLKEMQFGMNAYIRKKYPELEPTINEHTWGQKLSNEREYYMRKRNPDLVLTKDIISQKVRDCFLLSSTTRSFFNSLTNAGYTVYERGGKPYGIIHNNIKYRFAKLGISEEQLRALDKQNERLHALEKLRSNINTSRKRSRSLGL